MKPKVIHYAGELSWTDKRGGWTKVHAGWAACCSGDRAWAVRRHGNNTHDPKLVTCKECLKRLAWASVYTGSVADTPVDGMGLPLPQHAEAIAKALNLSQEQTAILVSELRNALVPVSARMGEQKGLTRVFALCTALCQRIQG